MKTRCRRPRDTIEVSIAHGVGPMPIQGERMRAALIFVLVAFLLGPLPGCASTPRSEAPVGAPAGSPVGAWLLVSIGGDPLPAPLPTGARAPTLVIESEGAISGVAGVNRFSGRADHEAWGEGLIRFGPFAVTRMAGPPEAMAIESSYLAALAESRGFTVSAGALVLTGEGGELLAFRAAD
jgi:heat shock protein HslJ